MKIKNLYSRIREVSRMGKERKEYLRLALNDHNVASEYRLRTIYYTICRYFDDDAPFLRPDLTVKDVADKLGYNYVYVRKAIKFFKNRTFNSFVNDYRIEFSKKMMASDKKLKMNQIALRCGYNSPESFSGNFKKREKISPGVWCQRHIGRGN